MRQSGGDASRPALLVGRDIPAPLVGRNIPAPLVGRNILVIGSPGSGKSTLALRLAAILGLRAIHMDQLYWLPGWCERPDAELPGLVADAIVTDGWVFDGNNSRTLAVRAEKADTLIWLDLPRLTCVRRILWRVALGYGRVRPDMAPGCPERFDPAFLRWVWRFPRHSRPGQARFFEASPLTKHRLRSPRAVRAFLRRVVEERRAASSSASRLD